MKKEYNVTITETLKMTVTVEAENLTEAEEIAEENWSNGDFRCRAVCRCKLYCR